MDTRERELTKKNVTGEAAREGSETEERYGNGENGEGKDDENHGVMDAKKTMDNGVLTRTNAPENGRDAQGRWLPGAAPKGGRPRRPETAVLRYMNEKIPAEKIVATVIDLIEDTSSWRAREAGVKLYLSYMVGMPVQRSVTATTRLETLLNRLGEMDDEEFATVEAELKKE